MHVTDASSIYKIFRDTFHLYMNNNLTACPIFSFSQRLTYKLARLQNITCTDSEMPVQWANIHNLLVNSHENYNTTYNTCRCTIKLYKRWQYNKVVNRTLVVVEVIKIKTVTIPFPNIRTSKSTYYLLYDNLTLKHIQL